MSHQEEATSMTRLALWTVILVNVCLVFFPAAAWSQAVSTSQISGVVQDPSGAPIADAQVTVTQTSTALNRSAITDNNGSYILTNLPVGPYQLRVSKNGFDTYLQNGIVLQVSTNPAINVTLKVGSVSETITVEVG
ncbi:MAG: carboxypeptidase regulatory-like domain-containing protein, partial [Acidobacteria bacterium]|nr:carboxypeptidase regulatory-like domain-containing protein [Acidobacteriota bacterium]